MLMNMILQGLVTSLMLIILSSSISAIKTLLFARKWSKYLEERMSKHNEATEISGHSINKKHMH